MFKHRKEAGRLLAQQLSAYKNAKNTLILAIPRGGVVIGSEIAQRLHLPLDVLVIRKIGFPFNEELALGAVGLKEKYFNKELLSHPEVSKEYVKKEVQEKQRQVQERYFLLRGKRKMYSIHHKTVILVDDGIATGATMFMAIQILRKQQPKKIIVAVPVAAPETVERLKKVADEVLGLEQPFYLGAIGQWYQEFEQVEDQEAGKILQRAWKTFPGS